MYFSADHRLRISNGSGTDWKGTRMLLQRVFWFWLRQEDVSDLFYPVPADWTLCVPSEPLVYTEGMVSVHAQQGPNRVASDMSLHADGAMVQHRCAARMVGLYRRVQGGAPRPNPRPLHYIRGQVNYKTFEFLGGHSQCYQCVCKWWWNVWELFVKNSHAGTAVVEHY